MYFIITKKEPLSKEDIETIENLNFNKLMKQLVHLTVFQVLTNENGCLNKLEQKLLEDNEIFDSVDILTYENALFSTNFF